MNTYEMVSIFKHSCQQQEYSFSSNSALVFVGYPIPSASRKKKQCQDLLREMKTAFPHKTEDSPVPTGLKHHPEQQDSNYLVSSLVFEFSCPVFLAETLPSSSSHIGILPPQDQNEFPFISEVLAQPLNPEFIDICILTPVPLVAYITKATKPKEHFYNRAFVTGVEIYGESRSLRFCSQLCQRIQQNLQNHHSTRFYFFPRP